MWMNFLIVCALTTKVQSSEIFPKFIYPRLPNYVENSENQVCNSHSKLYKDHLKNFTYWAYEMLDSSAKSPTGILRGSTYQLGNYQQCLSIDAPFATKYCAVSLIVKVPTPNPARNPFSLHFDRYESVLNRIYSENDESQIKRDSIKVGLCIPDSCASKDLEKYLTDYIALVNSEDNNTSYSVTVSDQLCHTGKESKHLDTVDISFCLFAALIIVFVVSSTIYGYNPEEKLDESLPKNDILKATRSFSQVFSASKNLTNLAKYNDSNPYLDILNGMRSFSMFAIIISHRYAFAIGGPLTNYDYVEKTFREVGASILFHADLFVDSFFMYSGILVAYLLLSNKTNQPHLIVIVRYFRLTPSYAFIIFYYASIFYYTGSGPFWNSIILQEVQDCRNNWWTNLLYINNYVNIENMCVGQTWYLPCDFHYFIMGLLLVLTLKKSKRLGFFLLGVLLLISIIIPFVITVIDNLPPMLFFYKKFAEAPKRYPYFRTYVKSHMRATPYIIGLITGYIYHHLKENPIKVSKKASYAFTMASLLLILLSLLTGCVYYNRIGKYSTTEAGAFAAFHRLPWTIGTAIFMITTSYGQITFLRSALSWKPWIPIAKLSFGAYLLHMQFPLRSHAGIMNLSQFNFFDLFHSGLADIFLTYIFALLLYLGIEAPAQNICKTLTKPRRKIPTHDIKEYAESRL